MELNWKPSRVVHCYKTEKDITHIIGLDGIVHLNKSASIIWNMSNGKNSIKEIMGELKKIYHNIDENTLFSDTDNIIDALSSRGLLIKNWNPLLKDNIIHEENLKWTN